MCLAACVAWWVLLFGCIWLCVCLVACLMVIFRFILVSLGFAGVAIYCLCWVWLGVTGAEVLVCWIVLCLVGVWVWLLPCLLDAIAGYLAVLLICVLQVCFYCGFGCRIVVSFMCVLCCFRLLVLYLLCC